MEGGGEDLLQCMYTVPKWVKIHEKKGVPEPNSNRSTGSNQDRKVLYGTQYLLPSSADTRNTGVKAKRKK